jgi:DNA-binding transcriptional LysR family regulator
LLRSLDSAVMQVTQGLAALADWRDAPSGSRRINTFGYAARTILAPRLPKFMLDHPDVSVEVIVEDRNIDLVAGAFDAGIRLSEAVEQDMVPCRSPPTCARWWSARRSTSRATRARTRPPTWSIIPV